MQNRYTTLPLGYRLATNPRECASAHALVYDTDLRYWRTPTAWEVTSPTAVIVVPHAGPERRSLRVGLSFLTAIVIIFGLAILIYVALHI